MLRSSAYQSVIRKSIHLLFLMVAALTIHAQTAKVSPESSSEETAIAKVITQGYDAYHKKDLPALLSLFDQQSPYLAAFKQSMEEDFAANERVRILGIRALLVRNIQFQGNRAETRLKVDMRAVDKDAGKEAEGFGTSDHTIRLKKENGIWKIWQFVETAEELAGELLAAKTDEERNVLLKAKEPHTDGLLRGLADQAESLLERKGDDERAEMIFEIALTLSKRANSLLGRANAIVGLGDVYVARGDYLKAADNYQQIMKIAEDLDVKQAVAALSVKLGNIHYYQGNFPQALEYYQASAKLFEKLGSTREIAYPLLSIGNAYFALNNHALALENYQKSLKIYERIFDKAGTAYLLNRIAEVHAAQHSYDQAIDFYGQSLKLEEEFGFKAMTATSLSGIGSVRLKQREYVEAKAVLSRAADLAREAHAPDVLWKTLTGLGQTHRALGHPDQAQQSFTEAISVLEKVRGQLVGNEREQQLFFEDKTAPYVEMAELLIAQNKVAEAFHYAELAKGRMLLDVLRNGRRDITTAMTSEERAREKSLNAGVTSLGLRLREARSLPQPDKARLADLDAQMEKARFEYEAYETRIYAAHPELKINRGVADPLGVGDVASLIRDDRTALLEFVVAPQKTYLFVLTKGAAGSIEIKTYVIAIGANELTALVRRFRQQLANNSLDFKGPARQLYDLLLKPAQNELTGKTTVGIVPAVGLWELPFQALVSPSEKYFLEEHAVFYAPSLSVLREMRLRELRRADETRVPGGVSMVEVSTNTTTAGPSLLALGNPRPLSRSISQTNTSDKLSFSDLPEAEREVKSLGEIYGTQNSRILTGTAAREETTKAEAGRYAVLHFATHGLLDDNNPLYSRLLLASSSGSDDGLLEAREIMKLDLRADLAVLSACQTARGHIGPGEGLIGMSWAFFIAGASTTVVSQWQVDAASTGRLMVDFHRQLQRKDQSLTVSKAEALRRAALKLMADPNYRHPFFWSGFVVVGNGM